MIQTKHTPGPWEVRYNQNGSITINITEEARRRSGNPAMALREVAFVAPIQGEISNPAERDDNAALIAAAPELLEALQEYFETSKDGTLILPEVFERWFRRASAAIAKATGGQS